VPPKGKKWNTRIQWKK